ncbi:reverse transcriptase [Lasius niger]|uniref:Reverse transcriptase n=1 Tax=Lasius niger TaxID=67767 RepID=A0A0J7KYG8_LASNI|nr:reverse transcriptase [Lasius niger]KMQ95349.1 reverse transcriptase [Lasius niger]
MAIVACKRMFIRQYDVKTAYLNGTLEKEVYMEVPSLMDEILRRIIEDEQSDHLIITEAKVMLNQLATGEQVCRMKKALYGLKQAGRA